MTNITVCHNEEKTELPVKDNGNLSVHSLKQYFPDAESLAYMDEKGQMRALAISLDEILIKSEIEEYYLHIDKSRLQSNGSTENGTNDNREDTECSPDKSDANQCVKSEDDTVSQPKNDTVNGNHDSRPDEKSVQKVGGEQKPIDSIVNQNGHREDTQGSIETTTLEAREKSQPVNSTDGAEKPQNGINGNSDDRLLGPGDEEPTGDADEKPQSSRVRQQKTLRIGWLHKEPSDRRYSKMKKPPGGVKRLKLDESRSYSAVDIRQLAIKEFGIAEDEYEVQLGLFGGQAITDFAQVQRTGKKQPAASSSFGCDDIWNYCSLRNTTPYKLNLFLLTRQRRRDNVHVLYHYARVSKYSSEVLYTECDKFQLHGYMVEQQFGDGPPIEQFEPPEHGYQVSRIERDGEVMLQVCLEGEDNSGVKKSPLYPAARVPPGAHEIVHDLDEVQGVCHGALGIGLVTSCSEECRPVFTWLRDGRVYKRAEQLCWLSDVGDVGQAHVWSCTVKCGGSERVLESKEVVVKGDC